MRSGAAGYEIVTIPSDSAEVELFSADRVLDSGQAPRPWRPSC